MIKDQISFVVVDENKLCAVNSRRPFTGSLVGWSNIRRGKIAGANRSAISSPENLQFKKNVRPATKFDFHILNCDIEQWQDDALTEYKIPTK